MLLLLFVVSGCKTTAVVSNESFTQFWMATKNELAKTPLSPIKITSKNFRDKEIQLFKLNSLNGIDFYVWVSEPIRRGKFNTKVMFSGFSEGNTDKNKFPNDAFMMEKNTICMKVDIRGQGLSTDQIPFENFLSNGNQSKENYIYRGAFMDAVRAIDFIAEHPKSNGQIMTVGGSQGGLLSLVATALNPKVDFCVANYPFLADIKSYKKRAWPFYSIAKGIPNSKASNILVYYDAINFAKLIKVPVFISCAEYDDKTPLEGIRIVYNNIQHRDKQFHVVPCEGHGCSTKSTFVNKKQKEFIEYNFRRIE